MQTAVVISANRFFREALLRLLRGDRALRVLGALELSPLISEQLSRLKPDVVVMHPEADDEVFRATRTTYEAVPEVKILMIGMRDDPELLARAVRAGAVGYLLKDASPQRILRAVRRLERPSVVCPQHLLLSLFHAVADNSSLDAVSTETPATLTPRERQLTALLAQGLANKEIAERLNLSLGTVKSHVHSILQKTQSKNRGLVAHIVEPQFLPEDTPN